MKLALLFPVMMAVVLRSSLSNCEDRIILPDSFGPSKEIREIAADTFRVSASISRDGEILIEAVLPKIKTRNSVTTGLPSGTSVSDWKVVFVLIPRLSESDLANIEKAINATPQDDAQKGLDSSIQNLRNSIPDLVGETYAYRILPTLHVPSEPADIAKVDAFVERLLAKLQFREQGDSRETLRVRMLR